MLKWLVKPSYARRLRSLSDTLNTPERYQREWNVHSVEYLPSGAFVGVLVLSTNRPVDYA